LPFFLQVFEEQK